MDGTTSKTLWDGNIPMRENPHIINPLQGYLASANQSVTDSTYPYWYNGDFIELRAWRINQLLDSMHVASVDDMFKMQNDVYSWLAAHLVPVIVKYLPADMPADEREYANELQNWDYRLTAESKAASVFQVWWYYLNIEIWKDQCKGVLSPLQERTMQILNSDSVFAEHCRGAIQHSFKECTDSLRKLKNTEWYLVKNTSIKHLTKLPAFSYADVKVGGWGNVIDAATTDRGPSWRMVVQMGKEIEAYGVYPGGQSGNPGSPYYSTFIDNWTVGKYYRLLFMPNEVRQNISGIKYTWSLKP
jgi:penicillin amidase